MHLVGFIIRIICWSQLALLDEAVSLSTGSLLSFQFFFFFLFVFVVSEVWQQLSACLEPVTALISPDMMYCDFDQSWLQATWSWVPGIFDDNIRMVTLLSTHVVN